MNQPGQVAALAQIGRTVERFPSRQVKHMSNGIN
jgi:hypothetical protein